MGLGFVECSLILKGNRQNVVSAEVVGFEGQGFLVLDNGLVVSFQANENVGQVDVGVGMSGIELHGLLQQRSGFVESSLVDQQCRALVKNFGRRLGVLSALKNMIHTL